MRSSLALWAAILAALALAACGGDDGPSAEEEAKRAAVRAVENDDAGSFCRSQVSKAYLERIYSGDVAACLKAAGAVPEDSGQAKATAAVVKPDEERAEITISIKGGDLDGTAGGVEMTKEGEAWKVDDYADDFIRSAFLAEIRTTDEGAVSTPEMKACFTRQAKRLPVTTIRRLTFASDGDEQDTLDKLLLKLAKNCPDSALAEYGARTLTEGLVEKGKHDHAYVECLHKEIKFLLELTGITTELLVEHPNFAAVAALEGTAEGAKQNCEG